jgi:lipoprotein-releasing system permease protein
MKYELVVALRYLWMARKRAHTAFLSIISTLGLGVGVATLLISLALLSGLQGQIKQRLMESSPHILIEPKGSHAIEAADRIVGSARGMGFRQVTPVVSGIAWAANREDGTGRPATVRSFDPAQPPAAETSFGRVWSLEGIERPIFMTRAYAAALGVTLGDEVTVVAPRTRLTPFGPVPVWKQYTVARLIAPPPGDRAQEVLLPFAEAANLFDTSGGPTSIEMYTDSIEEVDDHQSQLQSDFPGVLVKTWKEINRPLFLALRLEKIVMFATISLIIFVAALNLISSLSMLIVEKRPQVGVLRTLGATEGSILKLFLGVGLLIGVTGTILGNILGLGVSWAANRYGLVPLPSDIYFVSHVPFAIELPDVLGVNAIALVLSMLATLYPARVASRLDPIVAIKEE